jgi:hypothetical protein
MTSLGSNFIPLWPIAKLFIILPPLREGDFTLTFILSHQWRGIFRMLNSDYWLLAPGS